MKKLKLLVGIFLLGVVIAVPGAGEDEKIMATVNGSPITQKEIEEMLPESISAEQVERLRPVILEKLIEEKLLNEYFRQEKIETDEKALEEKLAQVRRDLSIRLRLDAYLTKTITPALLKKEFAEETKDKIACRHILVEVPKDAGEEKQKEAETKIKSIEAELQKGANFEEVAKKYSDCPSSAQGGDLGVFPREAMVKEFADAAFNLKIGKISPPVKTEFGWHLIEREEVSFEKMEEMLKRKLRSQLAKDLIAGLKAKAQIEKTSN